MAKNWIKGAIKHPGALKAKAEAAGESTKEFADKHKSESGETGSQARLAETLMGMHHGSKGPPKREISGQAKARYGE